MVTTAVVALTGIGAAGAASAAVPTGSTAPIAVEQPRPPEPPGPKARVHDKFKSKAECEDRGRRDFGGKKWECRSGPDRDNPWELWSD